MAYIGMLGGDRASSHKTDPRACINAAVSAETVERRSDLLSAFHGLDEVPHGLVALAQNLEAIIEGADMYPQNPSPPHAPGLLNWQNEIRARVREAHNILARVINTLNGG